MKKLGKQTASDPSYHLFSVLTEHLKLNSLLFLNISDFFYLQEIILPNDINSLWQIVT